MTGTSCPAPFAAVAVGRTFCRAERHDRFSGRQKAPVEGSSFFGRSVIAPGAAGRLGERGNRRARPKARAAAVVGLFDWRGLFAVLVDCWLSIGEPSRVGAQGRWRIGRHPIRPVLKHGPRSLTCARVMGFYET